MTSSKARFYLLRWPHRSWLAAGCVLFLVFLVGCGDAGPSGRLPLVGPGLHRAIVRGSQGTLLSWWLSASARNPSPRVLLWDGMSVTVTDPAGTDQTFTPLNAGLRCTQMALAPDGHAFACSQPTSGQDTLLIQSLDDLSKSPQIIPLGSAPFAWSPDSRRLAYLHTNISNDRSTCSVLDDDTSTGSADAVEDLLDQVPFNAVLGEAPSSCPVAALAWSPSGQTIAATLASQDGVNLLVLRLNKTGKPASVESTFLLPGVALQAVDSPAAPSLFWAPNSSALAVLTGYSKGIEDGLYLLLTGATKPLTEPHLTDTGEGAALAFSPDSRWLAVGSIGATSSGDNALLQVYDLAHSSSQTLGQMLVVGSTLGWSSDGKLLASSSSAQQGILLRSWPDGTIKQLVHNPDIAHLHQLVWSPDGSTLLFSQGSHINGPTYDELYAQAIPIPPGTPISLLFPGWFGRTLALLPQFWLGSGAALLLGFALVVLVLLGTALRRRPRSRALGWQAVGSLLLGLGLLFTSTDTESWLEQLYVPYSSSLCTSSPTHTCTAAGALAVLTVGGPVLLLALFVLLGAWKASRPRPVPPVVLPAPAPLPEWVPPLPRPRALEEPPLLQPPSSVMEATPPPQRLPPGDDGFLSPPW
jgi:WD40 repeat protein